MMDSRMGFADYYDLEPDFPDDVPFYLDRLPPVEPHVLELGCGTGRVAVALAGRSAFYFGVDSSASMLERCEARLRSAGYGPERAQIVLGDIAHVRVGRRFDLIVAPYRVLQNLESDTQVRGLFEGIREHLSPGGRCILNTFRPRRPAADLFELWSMPADPEPRWEVPVANGRVVHLDRRAGVSRDPLILYPELIYRRFEGGNLVEEAVLHIAMRCYYPDELLDLVRSEGFHVTGTWGGYHGEPYGEGDELVVEFS